jgi:hypothetical protein
MAMAELGAAAAILAGVFHIDSEAAEVFEDDLGCKPAVAAGTAGGDEDLTRGFGPLRELGSDLRLQVFFGEV